MNSPKDPFASFSGVHHTTATPTDPISNQPILAVQASSNTSSTQPLPYPPPPLPHLPLNLTFGVEFEFIVAYKRSSYLTPPPQYPPPPRRWGTTPESELNKRYDNLVRSHIVDVLRNAGLGVNGYASGMADYSNWTVDRDDSIEAEAPEITWPGSKWDSYNFTGVELKTPILPFTVEGLNAITNVLFLLRSTFQLSVNTSCGLHVHVGNLGPYLDAATNQSQKSVGFPLKTLKSIATLTTVFNRLFNSLHPSHRITNFHCLSPAVNFPACDPWTMASRICAAGSVDALAALMSSDGNGQERGMAYNFLGLSSTYARENGAGLNTIEFRQHEASLDAMEVGVWVTLVCEFVLACHGLNAVQLVSLVTDRLQCAESEFGIVELLGELGLGGLAGYYQGREVFSHPRLEWERDDPRMGEEEVGRWDGRDEAEREMEARGWPVGGVGSGRGGRVEFDEVRWSLGSYGGEDGGEEETDALLDRLDVSLARGE